MLVAVRPPRSGIGRILGLPTAIIIAKGIPLEDSFLAVLELDILGILPYIIFPIELAWLQQKK